MLNSLGDLRGFSRRDNRKRLAQTRRRKLSGDLRRVLAVETLEGRQLLASDVTIGADDPLTYSRVEAGGTVIYSPVQDSALIGAAVISADLAAGLAVTVATINDEGTQPGDLLVSSADLSFVAAVDASLELRADRDIRWLGSTIAAPNGSVAVTLNADRDQASPPPLFPGGRVVVDASSSIDSGGASITIGGGLTPLTLSALGSGGSAAAGVTILGDLNSAGGAISIRGEGFSGLVTTAAEGIEVRDGGSIVSASGNISLHGTGGLASGLSENRGILIGDDARIESSSGTIDLMGVQPSSSSFLNPGVALSDSNGLAEIASVSTQSGAITVTGVARSIGVSVGAFGGGLDSRIESTGSGSIRIEAVSVFGDFAIGPEVLIRGAVGGAMASGNITIIGDSMTLNDTGAGIVQSSGMLFIRPRLASQLVELGTTRERNGGDSLRLDAPELASIQAGFSGITLGTTVPTPGIPTGDVVVENIAFDDPLTLSGGSIATFGHLTSNGGLTLTALDDFSDRQGVFLHSGTVSDLSGPIVINAGDDFVLTATAVLSTPALVNPITINLDQDDADGGFGSTATLLGTFPAVGTTVNGGADADVLETLDGVSSAVTTSSIENIVETLAVSVDANDGAPGQANNGLPDEFLVLISVDIVQVFVNSSLAFQALTTSLSLLVICGSTDIDILSVDVSGGLLPLEIVFDDACSGNPAVPRISSDIVRVLGRTPADVTFQPGLSSGAGTLFHNDISTSQLINFFGVSDVELVGDGAGNSLTVFGVASPQTELAETSEYVTGSNSGVLGHPVFGGNLTGEVRPVNSSVAPSLEFSNFGDLIFDVSSTNSGDFLSLDNPIIPFGLTSISIQNPTGFNSVFLRATAGNDAMVIDETLGVTTFSGAQPLPIAVSGDLFVEIDGVGGDDTLAFTGSPNTRRPFITSSDTLSVAGPISGNTFTVDQTPFSSTLDVNGFNAFVAFNVGELILNGGVEDDTLNFARTGASTSPTPVTFNAGLSSAGDNVTLQGSVTAQIFTYAAAGPNGNNGSVQLDSSLLVYNGIEPITSTVNASDVLLIYGPASESITLTQIGSDITADATGAEITTFLAPTSNLSVITGGGADTVTINGLNVAITGDLTIDDTDDPRDDTLLLVGGVNNTTGRLVSDALTIDIQQDLGAVGGFVLGPNDGSGTITTNGTLNSTGAQVFNAPLNLVGNTSLITADSTTFGYAVNGPNELSVSSGIGANFLASVGAVAPPTSLIVAAGAAATQLRGNVTTTGPQTFNGNVILNSSGPDVTLTSNGGGDLTFASTIDNLASPANSLSLITPGAIVLAAAVGGSNPLGDLTIETGRELTIPANITAINDISLTVQDASSALENLTILSLTAVSSIAGSILLNVGDNLDIQAGSSLSAVGSMTFALDGGVDPDPGLGSTVTINGLLTTTSVVVRGGNDADTFLVTPQTGAALDIDGMDPTISPGDSLTIDGGGVRNVTFDVATASITVDGAQPITINDIEELTLSNIPVLTIAGSATADSFTLADNPLLGGSDFLTINGFAPIVIRTVGDLVINGSAGDDLLTFNATNALPFTRVRFNGQGQDGSGGGDALEILGSFGTQEFLYEAPGADGNNGTVFVDSQPITYTGLEPINGGNSIDTILTFSTGLANSATIQAHAAGMIEINDNGATFEDTVIPNPTNSLTITLGDQGDSLQINTLDAAYTASLIIFGGAGNDNVRLDAVTLSNASGRGLDVSGVESLTINNSTISGNTADVGGGLRVFGGSTTIDASTISDNKGTDSGGGIFTDGALTIQNGSLISGNFASGAGGRGGGILLGTGGTLTVNGSTITGNSASSVGGGLYVSAPSVVTITATTISNNTADGSGGGIFSDGGTINISGVSTSIKDNRAAGLSGSGGGIFSNGGSVSISDALISGNSATIDGGGLYAAGSSGNVTLTGTTISNNTAGDSGGGALILGPTTTISTSRFENNQAQGITGISGNGGGLFLGGEVGSGAFSITGTTFENNRALGGGGGAFLFDADGNVSSSSFLSNQVTGNGTTFETGGGGLTIVADVGVNNVTLSSVTVQGNTAPAAAGIAVIDARLTVSDSTISNNTASESLSGGGGIGAITDVPLGGNLLTLNRVTIAGNTTAGEGGGIGVINGDISISESTISGNQANGGRGGGIGMLNAGIAGTATIRGTTISSNTASISGGGIAVLNMGVDLENVTVSSNTAGSAGGGLGYDNLIETVGKSIRFSTFTSNTALGGSNVAATGSPIDVLASIFNDGVIAAAPGVLNSLGFNLDSGNTSGFANTGDLLNTDPRLGPLALNGGTVQTHLLLPGSPAIDAAGPAGPSVDARGFARPVDGDSNGSPLFDIGAVEAELPPLTSLVVDEVSDVDDGIVSPGNLSLREAVRLANDSSDTNTITFDAVVFGTAQTIVLSGSPLSIFTDVSIVGPGQTLLTISGNDQVQIFVISGLSTDVSLSGMTLSDGSGASGKAIRNVDANLTISDSTIANNTAPFPEIGMERGGGLFNGGNLILTNSTITGNRALRGAGIYNDSGSATITESSIEGNTATYGGGVLNTGTVDISNSLISLNVASEGAGVNNQGGMTIRSTSILNNDASEGGGIENGGTLSITDSTISDNEAGYYGGGLLNSGSLTVSRSTISGNSAGSIGGGFAGLSGSVSLADSTVSGNTAGEGGGLYNFAGLDIVRSTISGNTANSGGGGGIASRAGSGGGLLMISTSTVSGNTSAESGGGIAVGYDSGSAAQAIIQNVTITNNLSLNGTGGGLAVLTTASGNVVLEESIVAGNLRSPSQADDISAGSSAGSGELNLAGSLFNLIADPASAGGLADGVGGNIVGDGSGGVIPLADILDPVLFDNGGLTLTHALVAGSPAIDAVGTSLRVVDQRGVARPIDGDSSGLAQFDIGSFEFESLVSLFIDDVTVNESIGLATITVRSPAAVSGGFTVNVATMDGTAIAPGDYTGTIRTLSFAGSANETQTFTVPIIDDSIVESAETVSLLLSNASNSMIDASDVGVLTILDNDSVALIVDDVTVDEGVGLATITVRLPAAVSTGFTVDFTTMDGTAVTPGDYTASSGQLTFAGTANETQMFTVPIVNDSIVEATETVSVKLSNPSSSIVNTSDVGTLSILNNDTATLTVDDVTVNEDDGTATVIVSVDLQVQGGFTVNFATSDGTAVQPLDYLPASGQHRFAGLAGESQSFTVTIIDDNQAEATETILVSLANASLSSVNASDTSTIFISGNDNGQIRGTKFNDLNGDGDDESGRDPRLPGVTIVVTRDQGGTVGDTLITVTDSAGVYQVAGLAAGTYEVSEAPLTVTSYQIRGANTPVAVDQAASFDGRAESFGGGSLIVNERVHVISETQQWVEVSFDAASGGLAGNLNANWFANFVIQTDKSFSIPESFIYFRDGDVPLLLSSFATVSHPFDSSVGTINALGDTRGPSNSETLGIFSNPFSGLLSSNGIDPNAVTGLTLGYRLVLEDTPRIPTTVVPVSVLLAEGQVATDAANASGAANEVVVPDLLIGNAASALLLHTLSTGTGDGNVTVTVDGYGAFGRLVFSEPSDAIYDPVGPLDQAGTTFESGVAFRAGGAGPFEFLTAGLIGASGGLTSPTFTGDTSQVTSSFTVGGLRFDLTQVVTPQFDGSGARVGSQLTQTYDVFNLSSGPIDFELIRYLDGDLLFDGSIRDGGGRIMTSTGGEILFETDAGGTGQTDTTFIGISATNGSLPSSNRFEIDAFSNLRTRILSGIPLDDLITGDGDGDGFVDDGSEYDVTLALRNSLSLSAGGSSTFTTITMFGSGAPVQVVQSDLALSKSDTIDPVNLGDAITYTVKVTNNGPETAQNVVLTDTLPAGVIFVSATPDQGTASHSGGIVTANLGAISSGASVNVTIVATATRAGVLANTAQVTADTNDPNLADNTATELTTVIGLTTISGTVVCEVDRAGNTTPVVGTTVFIDLNGNGRFDPLSEPTTTTNSSGFYQFGNVPGGNLQVSVVVPVSCNTITDEPGVRRSTIPVASGARGIAAGHFIGDGLLDLVVVGDLANATGADSSRGIGSLSIVENSPSGFTQAREIPLDHRPRSVFVHDVSGNPMIAVAAVGTPSTGGSIFVLDQQSITNPSINPPEQMAGGAGPIAVLIDDFDGDNQPDILSASFRQPLLELRPGGSEEVIPFVSSASQIISIASGNLIGDSSRNEVVVAGFGYDNPQNRVITDTVLEVYSLDPSAEMLEVQSINIEGSAVDVAVEAVLNDADSISEIVTLHTAISTSGGSKIGKIIVYRMSGNSIGSRIETEILPGASAFDFGDFNMDGKMDVAVANLGGQFIELYAGDGDGRFALVSTITNVSAPSDLVVADFNGDGIDDIAVANFLTDSQLSGSGGSGLRFTLPSTVTVLQLNIAQRSVTINSNQSRTEDFVFPLGDPDVILDTNGDNRITALDALRVINVMARQSAAEGEQVRSGRAPTDVNGDGRTSAVDALMIINHLGKISLESEAEALWLADDDDERHELLEAIDQALAEGLF